MHPTRNSLHASAAREDTRPPPPATNLEGERPREPKRLLACLALRLSPNGRLAFTLIEMLIVISIISVLLGLLYGAIERAQKFSRRTITYTELKSIEAAWKQYYAYYHEWPSNELVNASSRLQSGEDRGFIIDGSIASMLQGVHDTKSEVWKLNPESIPFLEFSRYKLDSQNQPMPVNPFKSNSNDPRDLTRSYKVLFDTNGDRQIEVPPDAAAANSTNTTVISSVVVWTVIPATRQTTSSGQAKESTEVVFGSWESFNVK